MTTALPSPVPKDLRQQLSQSLERFEESELVFIHRVFLEAEKQRLWREIGEDAEKERLAGKWDNLPEVIQEVRAKLRVA